MSFIYLKRIRKNQRFNKEEKTMKLRKKVLKEQK